MAKQSAGILAYRLKNKEIEILLGHPGGPFHKNKDLGAWSIPKGEVNDDEDLLAAARREFFEETGIEVNGEFKKLLPAKQKSGKIVHAFAVEFDCDESKMKSNYFKLEWPPKTGKFIEVPELDRCAWFKPQIAKQKIIAGQVSFIDQLSDLLK